MRYPVADEELLQYRLSLQMRRHAHLISLCTDSIVVNVLERHKPVVNRLASVRNTVCDDDHEYAFPCWEYICVSRELEERERDTQLKEAGIPSSLDEGWV